MKDVMSLITMKNTNLKAKYIKKPSDFNHQAYTNVSIKMYVLRAALKQ